MKRYIFLLGIFLIFSFAFRMEAETQQTSTPLMDQYYRQLDRIKEMRDSVALLTNQNVSMQTIVKEYASSHQSLTPPAEKKVDNSNPLDSDDKKSAAPKKEADDKKAAAPKKEADDKKSAAPKKETDEKKSATPKKESDEKKSAADKKVAPVKKDPEEKKPSAVKDDEDRKPDSDPDELPVVKRPVDEDMDSIEKKEWDMIPEKGKNNYKTDQAK